MPCLRWLCSKGTPAKREDGTTLVVGIGRKDCLKAIDTFRISTDLGEKGERGILQSLVSRAAFLSDPEHRIQFVYLPKHTSWLNQVEIWLGILVRRVIRRGNFSSLDDLQAKILAFIDYFNHTAKPFRWNYTGRPLQL